MKDNIHYLEENVVLYPAGHNTVIYNTEQKTQKFIPGTGESKSISALAVSASKKYVAVAERAERGMVSVCDLHTLKRRKVLAAPDVLSKEYVSLAFSPDGKILAAQGVAPDWTLVLWAWEKSKVIASAKASNVERAALSGGLQPGAQRAQRRRPGHLQDVSTGGEQPQVMATSLGKRELANIRAMRGCPTSVASDAWCTATRRDAARGGRRGRTALPNAMPDGNSIECITPYSKGFVCSGSGGVVSIFEKSEDRDSYKKSKSFRIEDHPQRILSLAVSPSEETLQLETSQAFALGLSNSDVLKTGEFELFSQSFHSTGITGVDTRVQPLVATCSTDRSVRIWNYSKSRAGQVLPRGGLQRLVSPERLERARRFRRQAAPDEPAH